MFLSFLIVIFFTFFAHTTQKLLKKKAHFIIPTFWLVFEAFLQFFVSHVEIYRQFTFHRQSKIRKTGCSNKKYIISRYRNQILKTFYSHFFACQSIQKKKKTHSLPWWTLYIQVWSKLFWNWICLTLFVYHQSELVRRKVFAPESRIRCINMGNLSSLITWKVQSNSF